MTMQPHIGVTGHVLHSEYQFGTDAGNNVQSITDLQTFFTPDAPWGRIVGQLQYFVNFLNTTFAGRAPDLVAAARTHQFEPQALVFSSNHLGGAYTFGNIESGAIVTRETVFRPVIVEVLAKQPKGRAHWPSIWMYDYTSGNHTSDEIDILESQFSAPFGERDDRRNVYQIVHGQRTTVQNFLLDQWGKFTPTGTDLSEDYHYYTAHWFANGDLDMYVDGVRSIRYNIPWRGGEPNVIVYHATGSDAIDWTGPIVDNSGNGTDTFFPNDPNSVFKIRHIRIFKPVEDPNARSGLCSLRLESTNSATFNVPYQTVTIDSDVTYVLKAFIRGTGQKVRLALFDVNWNVMVVGAIETAHTGWLEIRTAPFITGANTIGRVMIQDAGTISGSIYIDDTFLGVDGGPNKISNAGFESGSSPWEFITGKWSVFTNPHPILSSAGLSKNLRIRRRGSDWRLL